MILIIKTSTESVFEARDKVLEPQVSFRVLNCHLGWFLRATNEVSFGQDGKNFRVKRRITFDIQARWSNSCELDREFGGDWLDRVILGSLIWKIQEIQFKLKVSPHFATKYVSLDFHDATHAYSKSTSLELSKSFSSLAETWSMDFAMPPSCMYLGSLTSYAASILPRIRFIPWILIPTRL